MVWTRGTQPLDGTPAEVPDEEAVEAAIADEPAPGTESEGFEEELIVVAPAEVARPEDWFTPEDLEEQQEGIGPPPEEEALHEVDTLSTALLDEGDTFEGLDEDAVEAAMAEATPAPAATARPEGSEAVRRARVLREDVQERMVDLERALTAPVGADEAAWWRRMSTAFVALRDSFRRHVAVTEAPGGLHEEIVAHAPRLAHARDRLVHDHVEITAALERLGIPTSPYGGVNQGREAALDVLGLLSRHRHRGADFVYEAYNFDIGGGD